LLSVTARIATSFNYFAVTDSNGYYEIPDMLDATQLDSSYSFAASAQFFNDSTVTGVNIKPNDTITVDFDLLHPEFTLKWLIDGKEVDSTAELKAVMLYQEVEQAKFSFVLTNTGNGHLSYESRFDFRDLPDDQRRVGRDELYDSLMTFNVTNAVGSKNINGVVWVDSLFIISAGGSTNDGTRGKFYRFTREGELLDSVAQPWVDTYGFRDMAYDGEFVWASGRGREADGTRFSAARLYKFDKKMTLVDSLAIQDSSSTPRCTAYDRENGVFYIGGSSRLVYAEDKEGNFLGSYQVSLGGNMVTQWGLAWYPNQPDSLKLLVAASMDTTQILIGVNPKTGECKLLTYLNGLDKYDRPLGMDVTSGYNGSLWTLLVTMNNSDGDRIAVLELDPNTNWISYTPVTGEIDAGDSKQIDVELNSSGMSLGKYWVTIDFAHNADPGFFSMPVIMVVDTIDPAARNQTAPLAPEVYGLQQNYPNPFNPSTAIRYGLRRSGPVKLTIWDTAGRLVTTLVDEVQTEGNHAVRFDAATLPNGVYICRLETAERVDAKKMVLLK